MSEILSEQSCEACSADAPKISDDELRTLILQIPDWRVEVRGGIMQLERDFDFANFIEALAFTNRVGGLAESVGHHPMLITEWGSVKVVWWSHKLKGLHRNDFILAAKTDLLFNM